MFSLRGGFSIGVISLCVCVRGVILSGRSSFSSKCENFEHLIVKFFDIDHLLRPPAEPPLL